MRVSGQIFRSRITGAFAIALLAATGGVAFATIPAADGTISGCYQTTTGALRVIDRDAGQQCNPSEREIDWNRAGLDGPPGPPGPSDAWDAQATGVLTPGSEIRLSQGTPILLPPGNYLISGAASWPPVESGAASVFCNATAAADGTGSTSGGFERASPEGGGSLSTMGALTVNSGHGQVYMECRHLSGTATVFVQARIHVLKISNLN